MTLLINVKKQEKIPSKDLMKRTKKSELAGGYTTKIWRKYLSQAKIVKVN